MLAMNRLVVFLKNEIIQLIFLPHLSVGTYRAEDKI